MMLAMEVYWSDDGEEESYSNIPTTTEVHIVSGTRNQESANRATSDTWNVDAHNRFQRERREYEY